MNIFKNIKTNYKRGRHIVNDPFYKSAFENTKLELIKTPKRTEVINFLLSRFNRETCYLEIGVRNPADNYNHIKAGTKIQCGPGF